MRRPAIMLALASFAIASLIFTIPAAQINNAESPATQLKAERAHNKPDTAGNGAPKLAFADRNNHLRELALVVAQRANRLTAAPKLAQMVPGKHTECQVIDGAPRCVAVDGVGIDQCKSDLECTSSHTACQAGRCIIVPEPGCNECGKDADCPIPRRLACRNLGLGPQCALVYGSGPDDCRNDDDCDYRSDKHEDAGVIPPAGTCNDIPKHCGSSCSTCSAQQLANAEVDDDLARLCSAYACLRSRLQGTGVSLLNISSGYRDYACNEAVGGAPGSYHLRGLAFDGRIDASCYDARFKDAAHACGLRVGCSPNESCQAFHVDLGEGADFVDTYGSMDTCTS